MEKIKVMVTVGTRPEIIRLSSTIKSIEKYFNLVLVHTGQNYDYTLNQVFFEEFGLREPDYYLNATGNTLGETVGNIIAKSYEVIAKEKPDAFLVLGDTNSCLAAYSGKSSQLIYQPGQWFCIMIHLKHSFRQSQSSGDLIHLIL